MYTKAGPEADGPGVQDKTRGPGNAGERGDWVDRLKLWHVALLFALVVLPGLGSPALFEPDEGRYATIAREMVDSGDFVTPRMNGVAYFAKPPLYYWLVAASGTALGWTEFAVRFVSAAMAFAGIVIVGWLGTAMGGHRTGVYAALLLAVAPYWAILARLNSIDMTISVLVLATLACFWRARRGGKGAALAWHGLFVLSALAMLTKGLIGVVLPGGAILLYLVFGRHWRLLREVPWLTGPLLFAVIAVPWHLLAESRHPGFLDYYFVKEHFLRYTTGVHLRTQPAWYLVAVIFAGLVPWSALVPSAFRLPFRMDAGPRRDAAIFLACWAGFVLTFFSLSDSKLMPYVLPAAPALAILVGLLLVDAEETVGKTLRFARALLTISLTLLALLFAAFLWFGSGGSADRLDGLVLQNRAVVVWAAIALLATVVAVVSAPRASLNRVIGSTVIATLGIVPCSVLVGSVFADHSSAREIARYLDRQGPDAQLIAFKCYPRTATYYLHQPIAVVEHDGEFAYGKTQMTGAERARRFPDVGELRRRWLSPGSRIFVITKKNKLEVLAGHGIRGIVAHDAGHWLLLKQNPASISTPSTATTGNENRP